MYQLIYLEIVNLFLRNKCSVGISMKSENELITFIHFKL